MSELPESNDIVKVTHGNGNINYVDDLSDTKRMSHDEIIYCHASGEIPDNILLHHALLLLDEAEIKNAKFVALLANLEKKLSKLIE